MNGEIQTTDVDDQQDSMGIGAVRWHYPIDEHGFCDLIDVMPRFHPAGRTADYAVVQAARVSFGQGLKSPDEDRNLIRYLMRHRHTTPFEMVEFKFHMKMPIFVARQFIRHRTANVNEYSGRYSEMPDEFWTPAEWRGQDPSNKQASEGVIDFDPAEVDPLLAEVAAFETYHRRIDAGVSREMARSCLPLSTYTEWYWKCDLHNIMHFLGLRLSPHAQPEIRVYAEAMYDALRNVVPITMEAFKDYRLDAVTLTGPEVAIIRARADGVILTNFDLKGREDREWKEKQERLGMSFPVPSGSQCPKGKFPDPAQPAKDSGESASQKPSQPTG